ncbi:MAG: hypothetical protein K9K38_21820 [Rhodoferax sp.]|nr:hypothetical protein [Rhodoferax sp.]MCF8212017.1 hypothetical protein [Rhodoferax sp.]
MKFVNNAGCDRVLPKLGLDLCVPIEKRDIAGKTVCSIGGGTLLACLDEQIKVSDAETLALGMAAWRVEQGTADDTTGQSRLDGLGCCKCKP